MFLFQFRLSCNSKKTRTEKLFLDKVVLNQPGIAVHPESIGVAVQSEIRKGHKNMSNFREYNQQQGIFRVIIPDELLEEDHPARIIDRVIETLDLSRIYSAYSDEGNPPYHPRMQLKILFYSYFTGLMSCRKIWSGLKTRADYIFLSGDQVPDFRTINSFRIRHMHELPDLFTQIIMLCERLGMIGFEHLAIDGEKIQANASYRKSMNHKRLESRYDKVIKGMEKLLNQDPGESPTEQTNLKRLTKLKREKKKLEALADKLKSLGEKGHKDANINLTDEEAPVMKHKNGRSLPSYNHQSTVDKELGVTIAVATTVTLDSGADLLPLVDAAEKNAGKDFEKITADSGFCDYGVLKDVEENRTEEYFVPDRLHEVSRNKDSADRKFDAVHFMKDSDCGLICPEGHTMRIKAVNEKEDHNVTIYEGTRCGDCPVREKCTKGNKRTVSIDSREPYRDIMRDRLNSARGREIYSTRQWLVEAPHGHDQKNMKWIQHHLRGLAKAKLEFMLIRIGANLGKICRYRASEMLALT